VPDPRSISGAVAVTAPDLAQALPPGVERVIETRLATAFRAVEDLEPETIGIR
jgi:hypothetical protein